MSVNRKLFYDFIAQTSEQALGLEVDHASGIYIYDKDGKAYMDLNSGISVSSLGHSHPSIVEAVALQASKYMHTMVYGEHIQEPQTRYAELLFRFLDKRLNNIYFVNSGTEAVEGALKLARKYTGRYEIISAAGAYHGSTIAAEALRSDISFTKSFMPTVPGVRHIRFNNEEDLDKITEKTACVIMEPVQAEGGILIPAENYLQKVQEKCHQTGALFILDEIQTGFGRTGFFFAHQKYQVVPDVLLLAKAMGGGMPVGAFIAPRHMMSVLAKKPMLGHITTFGGHPVCIAGALAALRILAEDSVICHVSGKEALFKKLLQHPAIAEVRSSGLMMAVELRRHEWLTPVISRAFQEGIIVDYFLFDSKSFRIAPPLIISENEIAEACKRLLIIFDEICV